MSVTMLAGSVELQAWQASLLRDRVQQLGNCTVALVVWCADRICGARKLSLQTPCLSCVTSPRLMRGSKTCKTPWHAWLWVSTV